MLRGRLLSSDSSTGDDSNFESLVSIGVPAVVVALLVLALRLQLPQRLYAFVAEGCKTAQTRAVEGGAFYFALADALQLSKTHYASMDSAGGKTLKGFTDGILSCLYWQPPQQTGTVHAGFTPLEPLPSMLHREFIKLQHLCRRGEPVVMAPAAPASSSSSGGGCCRGDGEEPLANRVLRCLAEAIAQEEVIARACTTRRNRLLEWFVGGVLVHDLAQGPAVRGRVLRQFLGAFHAAGGDNRVLFVPPDPCSVLSVKGGVLRGLAPSAVAVNAECDFMQQGQHHGVDVSFECSTMQHAVVTVDGVAKSSFTLDEVAQGVVHVARTLPSAKLSSTELSTSTLLLVTICTLPGGAVHKSAPSALDLLFEPDAEYDLHAMSAYWRSLFKTQQVRRLSSDRPVELSAVFQSLQLVKNAAPAATSGAGDTLNTTTGSSRDGAVTGEGDEIEPVEMFKGLHAVGQNVVIGDAGMGKTTLLKYLAYLWAAGNCPALSRYEHVFSVTLNALERYFKLQGPMRDGTASSSSHASAGHVPRVVVQWLTQDNAWGLPCVNSEPVAKLLADMDGKVLWLIDGVDEIQLEEGRSTAFQTMVLEPLLQSKSTVVTSRPMLRWVDDFMGKYTARYIIKGLSSSARDAFVQSYVCDYYKDVQGSPIRVEADHILQRLLGEPSLQTFSRNPCLLEAVCCLAVEGKLPVMGAVRLSDIYSNFTAVLEHRGFRMCTVDVAASNMGNGRAMKPWSARGAASNENRATLRAFIGSVARQTWEHSAGGNPVVQSRVMKDAWTAHGSKLKEAGLSRDTLPRLGFLRPEQTGVEFAESNWFFLHKSLLEWYTAVYLAAGLHTGQVKEENLEELLEARLSDIVWPMFFGCVFNESLLETEFSDAGEKAALRFVKRAVQVGWNQPSFFFTLLGELPSDVALGRACLGFLSEDKVAHLTTHAVRERHARATCLLLRSVYWKSTEVFFKLIDGAAHALLEEEQRHSLQCVFQYPLMRDLDESKQHSKMSEFQRNVAVALIKAYCDARYSVTEHCGRHPVAEDVRHRMKQLLAKGIPADCDVAAELFLFGCGEGDLGLVKWCLGQGGCDDALMLNSPPSHSADSAPLPSCILAGICFACGRGHLATVKYLISLDAIAANLDDSRTDGCVPTLPGQTGKADSGHPLSLEDTHDAFMTNSCTHGGGGDGATLPRASRCHADSQHAQQPATMHTIVKAERGDPFVSACKWGRLEVVKHLLCLSACQLVDVDADGDRAFRSACVCGHVDVVRELLALTGDRAIDVHADNECVFRLACGDGRVEIVRELLGLTGDQAVDVHADDGSAFQWACGHGHVDVVRELLCLTGDRAIDVHADGDRAFRSACVCGHVDVVRELLSLTGDRAIDVHADNECVFRLACGDGRVEIVRELLGLAGDQAVDVHADDGSAFQWACGHGHVDVVRELLCLTGDRAIDVHADGDRAFRSACVCGHVDVVRELLSLTGDRAIDVHADNECVFRLACGDGRVEIVRELLGLTGDRYIDVHAGNEGAFQSACDKGRVDVVRELLGLTEERAIDVNVRSECCFRSACGGGHVDVVRELLSLTGDRATDVHARNSEALTVACGKGHINVVQLLLGCGGDRAPRVSAASLQAIKDACQRQDSSALRSVQLNAALYLDEVAQQGRGLRSRFQEMLRWNK